MKNQIIVNESMDGSSNFEVKLDLIKQDKIPQRGSKSNREAEQQAATEEYLKSKISEVET